MEYPYFIYPAVKALRNGVDDENEAARLRRIVAANVGDTGALRIMLGIDPAEFAAFYPDLLPPSLNTADTIDSFLSKFGNADAPTPKAAAEIPVAPAPVYSIESLTTDPVSSHPGDPVPQDSTLSAIDSFLSSQSPEDEDMAPSDKAEKTVDTVRNEENLSQNIEISEAKAREYIKNHDYSMALQIIQQLILNNPEKSVYFADQIRFLKKLLFLEAHKTT